MEAFQFFVFKFLEISRFLSFFCYECRIYEVYLVGYWQQSERYINLGTDMKLNLESRSFSSNKKAINYTCTC